MIKAYLKHNSRNEYVCHQCDHAIPRKSSYALCNYDNLRDGDDKAYTRKMHLRCVRLLVKKNWIDYLDLGCNCHDDINYLSPDSSWDRLIHASQIHLAGTIHASQGTRP